VLVLVLVRVVLEFRELQVLYKVLRPHRGKKLAQTVKVPKYQDKDTLSAVSAALECDECRDGQIKGDLICMPGTFAVTNPR
jgi:hypothetical protein